MLTSKSLTRNMPDKISIVSRSSLLRLQKGQQCCQKLKVKRGTLSCTVKQPNFPQKLPKRGHNSFYLRTYIFQNSPKSCHLFGLLLQENLLTRPFKISPIWSHCALGPSRPLSICMKHFGRKKKNNRIDPCCCCCCCCT